MKIVTKLDLMYGEKLIAINAFTKAGFEAFG
jgi:hypothetical protein